MTLPARLTLVRHGESEANVAQRLIKAGRESELPIEAYDLRHDSYMRLSPLGEEQAKATGAWLYEEALREAQDALQFADAMGDIARAERIREYIEAGTPHAGFDRYYVSPHIRTQETAFHLDISDAWLVDDRLRERDWGEVVSHRPMDDETRRVRSLHEWYWKPQGGESLATGLRARVESLMNSFYRREGIENIIMVGHGEVWRVFQFVIERLSPQDFLALEADSSKKVHNTMVLQYASVDPIDPADTERHSHFKWRRVICPWDRSLDWDGGEWVSVDVHKRTNADLRAAFERYPRLLEGRDNTVVLPVVR